MKRYLKYFYAATVLVLFCTRTSAQQQNKFIATYNGESVISASSSITLTDGFHIPAGNNVHIFTTGANVVNCLPFLGLPSADQNYISTKTFKRPGILTDADAVQAGLQVCDVNQTIQYFDGLGRPLQDVQTGASPDGDRDIIAPKAYDNFGREKFNYLPYSAVSGNGIYRSNAIPEVVGYYSGQPAGMSIAFNSPFSERRFENSPINRVLEEGAPGVSWQLGTGHTIKNSYETNTAGEVNKWVVTGNGASIEGTYDKGVLEKVKKTDENGHETITYKDWEGRTVLLKVQADIGYLSTYYIYDNRENLRYVVPPKVTEAAFNENGTTFLNYIYGYQYDDRNREVRKKIPGRGWESFVYNKIGKLVATQNAEQAKSGLWTFSKFDAFERVIEIGEVSDGRDQASLSAYVDNFLTYETFNNTLNEGYTQLSWPTNWNKLYQVNYYDDYTFPSYPGVAYNSSASEVTQTMTQGLLTANKVRNLVTGEMLWTVIYYDTRGRIRESVSQNHVGGTDRVVNTYNFTNALTNRVRTHSSNWEPNFVISNTYTYDHIGRKMQTWQQTGVANPNILISELQYNNVGKLIQKKLHGNLQTINYTYNERGWLNSQISGLFSQQLNYVNTSHGALPQFNGNIAEQEYSAAIGGNNFVTYEYDVLNRLKAGNSSAGYSETGINYDEVGNLLTLNRQNKGNLNYYSYEGNRLKGLSGYKSGTFVYDENGNLQVDGMREVNIEYNFLELPQNITGSRTISYTYDATGKKLRKASTTTGTTDYIDGIEYEDGVLTSVQTEEGRAIKSGTEFNYEYILTDHLGNNRVTFDTKAGIANKVGEEDYYPFGLNEHKQTNAGNLYLYNKKELQQELDEYDYGARFYDPVIGRWNVVDPLSEEMRRFSPYAFVFGNPIRFVDPDGMMGKLWVMGKDNKPYWDDNAVSPETTKPGDTFLGASRQYVTKEGYGVSLNPNKTWNYQLYSVSGITKMPEIAKWSTFQSSLTAMLPALKAAEVGAEIGAAVASGGIAGGEIGASYLAGQAARNAGFLTELAESGSNLVYHGVDAAGVVRYVGITGRDALVRFEEHLASTGTGRELLDYSVIRSGLSREAARIMEQNLINEYKLGKFGGQLLNRINSIAPKHWLDLGIKF